MFLLGDYEFLGKMYESLEQVVRTLILEHTTLLTGRHCCLHCNAASDELQVPLTDRGPKAPRDLNTLSRDYLLFCSAGKGNIKNANNYNNVIGTIFFEIPLAQVKYADW